MVSEKVANYGRGLLKDFSAKNVEALLQMPGFMKKLMNATVDGENFFYSCVKEEKRLAVLMSVLTDNITRQKAFAEALGEETVAFKDSKGVRAYLMMLQDHRGVFILHHLLLRSKELSKLVMTNEIISEIIPGTPTSYKDASVVNYPFNFFIQLAQETKGRDILAHYMERDEDLRVPLKVLLHYYPWRKQYEARTSLHDLLGVSTPSALRIVSIIFTREPIFKSLFTTKVLAYPTRSPPTNDRIASSYVALSLFHLFTRTAEGSTFLLEHLFPCKANNLLDPEKGIGPELLLEDSGYKNQDGANRPSSFALCNMLRNEQGTKVLEAIYERIPDMKQRLAPKIKELDNERLNTELENSEMGRELLAAVKEF